MSTVSRLVGVLFLVGAAAGGCRHANLSDNFGQTNRATYDQQAANKSGESAGTLDGKDSENVMTAHHAQTPAGQTGPAQAGAGEGGPGMLPPPGGH